MATQQQPKVTLHWLDGSRAQNILWLLEELEVPYELEIHHRNSLGLAPPELAKIHPLGKAPILTITPPEGSEAVVLAEGPFIAEYVTEHWGKDKNLVPKQWKDGQEGKILGETEEWLRFKYLLYFVEGTLFPYLLMFLILNVMKGPRIPFLVRPITSFVANKMISVVVQPNTARNLALLESYLEKSPYLCGDHITAADIMLSFPLMAAQDRVQHMGEFEKGTPEKTFPKVFEYIARLEKEPGYKKSADKIREIEGDFYVINRAN